MRIRRLLPTFALVATTFASQPGSIPPVPAPMRDLQWGTLNFLATTDLHGWLGGHLQESQYSADLGDYVSFVSHMRREADSRGTDLIVVDTGDRVEGNGLYDASEPKGLYTYDIYKEVDVDVLCSGNHELYQRATADREREKMVSAFKGRYLASNLDYIDPVTGDKSPLAPQRYKRFTTKNQRLNIVSFGFIFNFDRNANNTVVQRVEDTIKEEWFQQAIREKDVDLFLVIGHVGVRMPEFKVLFKAIRAQNWYVPIAFFGGHAHVRDAVVFDDKAFAMASGRYFETIGFMSVDGLGGKKEEKREVKGAAGVEQPSGEKEDVGEENGQEKVSTQSSVKFSRRYIDNNLLGLQYHTGLNDTSFPTEHGKNVTKMISKARKALNLDKKLGCAPRTYWMARSEYPSKDSIFTWLDQEVLPDVILRNDREDVPRLAIINTGSIRFDIFKGPFTLDATFITSPFESRMVYIQDVPYAVAKKVLGLLNSGGPIFEGLDLNALVLPEQRYGALERQQASMEAISAQVIHPEDGQQRPMGDDEKNEPDLIAGYTTKDDVSTDGDDAIHSPISFYKQPQCVQAEIGMPKEGEPETVDLVFTDFLQPYVFLALKFSGGDYDKPDVHRWDNATFTQLMVGWIEKNWTGDC